MATDSQNASAVEAIVSDLASEADSAIRDLQAAASARITVYASQEGFDNNPTWENLRGREVEMAGLGDLPADSPVLTLPEFLFNPEDYLNSDLLEKYSYQSDFYDNFLDERLRSYIDSNALFLDQNVQDALFRESRERDLQVLSDATDEVDRSQATRGFPTPFSLHQDARNDVIKKHMDTETDRNSKVTALIADKSLQEKMHAIDAGNTMEGVRSKFQLEYGKLYWNAAQYIIEKYKADISASIAEFQSNADLIKLKTGVDESMSDQDIKFSALENAKQLERLRTTVQEMVTNFASWQQEANMRVKAAEDAIQYYKSAIGAGMGVLNDMAYKNWTE